MSGSNADNNIQNKSVQLDDVNSRLTTRRAALRKIGITTGAALFGMLAGDDLVRAVAAGVKRSHSNSLVANFIVKEFSDSGVAFARSDMACGVMIWGCVVGGPCRACVPPESCDDCMTVADFAFCECQQAADNAWPGCCDSEGNPNGDPGCPAFNAAMFACESAHTAATEQC